MSLWTMGLNQSARGTWQVNALCNLHLATGQICREGTGPFSLTGQPNAMGGREVGYMSGGLPGHRSVHSARDRAETEALWGLPDGAIREESGLPAVELFKAMERGEVRALWVIGSNPAVTLPNRARVLRGLERAEFVVSQDAYHPTETSRHAHVLLPGRGVGGGGGHDDQFQPHGYAYAPRGRAPRRGDARLVDHLRGGAAHGFWRGVRVQKRGGDFRGVPGRRQPAGGATICAA